MVDFGGSRCPGLGGQQSGGQKFLHSLPSLRLLLLLVVRRYRPYLSPIPSISFRPATVGGEALGAFWNVIAALPSERLTPSSLGVDAKKPIRAVRSVTRRLARPAAESRHGGLYVLLPFLIYLLFKIYFNESCQTNYLKI